ncbi:hypothetical protein LCGC14_2000220 [marine sediment metagenome]|uniref:PKD domain-containing protein n=1 Tax=marine sediment metagenome TaxID=412755 RepID=A0A0F9I0J0_9ZZZZ
MKKNKVVKLSIVFVLLSLSFLNISVFISLSQEQQQMSSSVEFSVYTAQDPNAFISVWDTTAVSGGSSGSNQVRLPTPLIGTYDFTVDWGDGSNSTIKNQYRPTHTYASEGIYIVTITGTIVGWQFNNNGDKLKIREIQQWVSLRL